MLSTTLTDNQQQLLHDVVVDKKQQTDAAATVSWSSSDTSIATITAQDPEGASALLVAQKPGQCTLTATCGSVTQQIGVTVTASTDANINVTFDEPTDQPDAATPPAAPSTPAT